MEKKKVAVTLFISPKALKSLKALAKHEGETYYTRVASRLLENDLCPE